MDQSGYSYCNSTPKSAPLLKVKSVRFNPGWTRPSTVQTSRPSFFSRERMVAFAPFRTASTRAIESFQRNPKGGFKSSAAGSDVAAKTNAKNKSKTRGMGILKRSKRSAARIGGEK